MGSIPTVATMTKLVYIKGDILKSDERVIVHGCNCFNSMGAGIARQIRQQFPAAYAADIKTLPGDKGKLGRFTDALCENAHGNPVHIVNAYTQYRYTRSEVDVDYDALEKVFTRICLEFRNQVIAMPKVGCGMASGDWNIVSAILERIGEKFNATFHIYEFEKSTGEDRRFRKSVEEDEADWKERLDRYRTILDKQFGR